ncbi:hypothetical protein [Methylobacterium aquaticum]|uniref:Bacteriophage protein n=1 Tax=Methylobacterium aquaticum TaxID=270351 RepID=A0A0J6SFJ7_9HYPH|nr:hypothetical protein [Methylobacterium aquaticum]KMO32487.1 bacteriophage protein [Methylobacterium aquaticum]
MAALTADRLATVQRPGSTREPPVKGGVVIWQGGMVAIDATGLAVPAAAVAAHRVIGITKARADNRSGADGDIRVRAEPGIYRFANSAAADAIALTDIGQPAYVVDDQTVAKTSNSNARPVAGTIFDVDAQGVWVRFA